MEKLEKIMSEYACNKANLILERKGSKYYSLAKVVNGMNVPIGLPVVVRETQGKYVVLSDSESLKITSLLGD